MLGVLAWAEFDFSLTLTLTLNLHLGLASRCGLVWSCGWKSCWRDQHCMHAWLVGRLIASIERGVQKSCIRSFIHSSHLIFPFFINDFLS